MKLQKQLSRKVGTHEYPKYVITIPPKLIKELGWKAGQDFEIIIKQNNAMIKPKK